MTDENKWLYAQPTSTSDAWIITLFAGDATSEPAKASFFWPSDAQLMIPNSMILMTVAAFDDLLRKAGMRTLTTPDTTTE